MNWKGFFYFLVLAFIIFSSGVMFRKFYTHKSLASPIANFISKPDKQKNNSLEDTVLNSLGGTQGTYAVTIKNLKTNESYSVNEHKSFESGSLYKLWIMATVYKQIQEGNLSEDQELSDDVTNLNSKFNIDPDTAELTDGQITLTVKDALTQMITISHNYAALLLTEQIKLSSVAAFLKINGFNESAVGTDQSQPTTTASDIADFFEKLYKGQLANEQYTKEMVDLLKNQQLNDGIPKYLPEKTQVAHKTGDIDNFKHDAGIVFGNHGDYILTAFSESDMPSAAQERIAQLSKSVYDYYTNPGK